MNRPLIIIAGAEEEQLGRIARILIDALERKLPSDATMPRVTSTTGDADRIILPAGWHTTHS